MNTETGGMRAVHWPAKKRSSRSACRAARDRDTIAETRTEDAQGYLNPRDANPDDAETHDVPGDEVTSETMVEPAQDGLDETQGDIHGLLSGKIKKNVWQKFLSGN
ncbi:hypothetical protein NKH99_30865 [Mesorhizobium sp. M0854]|uniref:hypothetical protein n=1 Tax=unclassified Mesorhizobium TaxID=325217 RepID=UPI00333C146A